MGRVSDWIWDICRRMECVFEFGGGVVHGCVGGRCGPRVVRVALRNASSNRACILFPLCTRLTHVEQQSLRTVFDAVSSSSGPRGAQQRRTSFGRSRSETEILVALKLAYDLRLVSLRDEDAAGVVVSMGELSDR
ncbi:hypothetical protein EAH_00059140 [Eimeria acervulina]|uniref:Uncharacterized protein n=1 Tax=Eimeria acervulina TaxID=5801 RepID=U6GLT1_EIMAC|nr:hypothetical protein EAH_00059140 [Eimeria acervulina]CDI81130.1 hypothetical protein EAH_00059140 [Eimeria acervulina]